MFCPQYQRNVAIHLYFCSRIQHLPYLRHKEHVKSVYYVCFHSYVRKKPPLLNFGCGTRSYYFFTPTLHKAMAGQLAFKKRTQFNILDNTTHRWSFLRIAYKHARFQSSTDLAGTIGISGFIVFIDFEIVPNFKTG